MYRDNTKVITIGNRKIGGGNPILIQSMTNTKTDDVAATVSQIHRLTQAGCEIIRCTVPDDASAKAISEIKKEISIPLVADIHFDYRMAIAAIENGAESIDATLISNGKTKAVTLYLRNLYAFKIVLIKLSKSAASCGPTNTL